jgi:hypothetical protein
MPDYSPKVGLSEVICSAWITGKPEVTPQRRVMSGLATIWAEPGMIFHES